MEMRRGVVTQVSPLLVKVGASTIGTPCSSLFTYAPVAGDQVIVFVEGSDRFTIGKIRPA